MFILRSYPIVALAVISLVSLGSLLFSKISTNKVLGVSSAYTAEVINRDQGALGGDTLVDIRSNSNIINLFFYEFSKSSITVYWIVG